jgi:hypothetical protein
VDLEAWWGEGWRRVLLQAAAVGAATILLGAMIGTVIGHSSAGSNTGGADAVRFPALDPGTLVASSKVSPKKLDTPRAMGSKDAGLALVALSEEDVVPTSDGERRAPDGGDLITFRVADWTCEDQPCKSWTTLKPTVTIDGSDPKPLPAKGSSFILAVPPGTSTVELGIDDAGFTQSESLLDDTAGSTNIALLARKDPEQKIPIGMKYQLLEQTSIPLTNTAGQSVTQFVREAVVDSAQLHFFLNGRTPSAPDKAFLAISTYYTYQGTTTAYAFDPGDLTFVAPNGTKYPGEDLDPSATVASLGFEIPATLKSGTLVIGGITAKQSSTGVPYTSSMQQLRQPIKLR